MTRARASLALVITSASIVTLHLHHKRPTPPVTASVFPLRAGRSQVREPLPVKPHGKGPSRPRPLRVAAPAGSGLADVTAYCRTGSRNAAGRWPRAGDVAVLDRRIPFGTRVLIDGNVFTVEDWIGTGSDYDEFFDGPDCERRALAFGRKHLRVVVER